MSRKRELYESAEKMADKGIGIILVQIHEAHSSAWPTGLANQPAPQTCLMDRMARAKELIDEDQPPFPIFVDTWEDGFEQVFHAWPDKFYLIDRDMRILRKSTYGAHSDALIDEDCIQIVRRMIASPTA